MKEARRVESQIKGKIQMIQSSKKEQKGARGERLRTRGENVQIFVPLLYQDTPSSQTSEAEWQTDRCLLHTTVMFYQPLRPCQSMASMFQNIFNTQREHFSSRKWIVRKIGRGLSGCVSHQRPFVLPLSQALGTKTFPFVSFVFGCDINFLFYIWLQEKTQVFFSPPEDKKAQTNV